MDTTAPPLPRNTENQYVILSFGLSEDEKIKVEEFDFTSGGGESTSGLVNKVYLEFTKVGFRFDTYSIRILANHVLGERQPIKTLLGNKYRSKTDRNFQNNLRRANQNRG